MKQKAKLKLVGDLLADIIAEFGGSWTFILGFAFSLMGWTLYNFFSNAPFDPFPFVFLNLILSTLAALQAPIIMMSQNRQAEKDRKILTEDFRLGQKTVKQLKEMNEQLATLIRILEEDNEQGGGRNAQLYRPFEKEDLED